MERLRSRVCLGVVLLASTLLSSVVLGQTQTTDVPIRQFKDDNGVDLLSGLFTTTTAIAVGDAENGLAFSREIRGAYALDNMLGEIVLGTPTRVTINGRTEKFTQSGSVFTPVEQSGSTLTLSGSTYTYRTADGTIATFTAPPANYYQYGNARGIVPNSLTYPSGKVLTFSYTVGSTTPPGSPQLVYGRRLSGVSSNTGYSVTFTYETSVLSSTNIHLWTHVTKVSTGTGNPSLSISTITGETPGVREYKDAMGRITRYTFSTGISAIRLPGSLSDDITVAYSSGRVSAVTAFGVTTNYSYSDAGNIRTTTVTRGSNPSSIYKFDLTKLVMTSHQNEAGHETKYQYNNWSGLFRVTMPEGNYVEYGYDARGNSTSVNAVSKGAVLGNGLFNTAGYDASCSVPVRCNKPNWTKDPKGNQTDYTYDDTHGGVLTITAPAPSAGAARPQTRITYVRVDSSGVEGGAAGVFMPKTISTCQTLASCEGTADEARTTFVYGNKVNVASVTSATGNGAVSATTTFTYDAAGNVTSVDGPLSGAADLTLAAYNAARQPLWQIGPDPDGAGPALYPAVQYVYRSDGQVDYVQSGTVTVQSQSGISSLSELQRQTASYDSYHRPIRQELKSGSTAYQVTDVLYDALGRVQCSMVRMDPSSWSSLPSSCNPTQTTGPNGPDRVTYNHYDALSRVLKVTSGYGTTEAADDVVRTFTNNGKLETLKDAENNLTTYEYDGYDRLVKTRFPLTTKGANASSTTDYEQLGYDNNGNVTSFRTRRDETLTLEYDNLNRLVKKVVPERSGLDSSHTRDVYFRYDLLGNMTDARFDSLSGPGIVNAFNALGQLTSTTSDMDGTARTLSYLYDVAGSRTRITHPDTVYFTYARNAAGGLDQINLNASSPLVKPILDAAGRLNRLDRWRTSPGDWLARTTVGYDPVSRVSSVVTDVNGTSYDNTTSLTYNPASQIASSTRDNNVYAWNRQAASDQTYSPDGLNRYTGASFTYDANGNLTSDSSNTFVYDVENRLVSRSGAASATLRYDPLGRLYGVDTDTTTRRFLYDGSDLIAEYNGSGDMQRRYVHGLSPGDDVLVQFSGDGTADINKRMLYADERGSTILVTDSTGERTSHSTYDEYGVRGSTNSGDFQYTGQMWLPELGMYYYKARMYSPLLGRFMQADPIGYGDGMNMYAYVGNDPVNYTDPSGLGGCYTITFSQQSRGSAISVEPARNDDGSMSDASGGGTSDGIIQEYSVTICTDGTIIIDGGNGIGRGGGPQGPRGPQRMLCSSGEAPSDPRARNVTRTVIGGGIYGHVPTVRYHYSLPAGISQSASGSVVPAAVVGGAEIGGATGGWLGGNYLGSWAAHHGPKGIIGAMSAGEGLGSGALLGSAAGGVVGALFGLLVGAANDEAHQTKCEKPQ